MINKNLNTIKNWLSNADAMVILTGAGMGVDSGMADFRGNDGLWGQVEQDTELTALDVSNPDFLNKNPQYAWTLFIKRMLDYKNKKPHKGYDILLRWIKEYNLDYFVLSSNVDEHFITAGFDSEKYRELHGSMFYMQCNKPCSKNIWRLETDLNKLKKQIDNEQFPICDNCGSFVRPNVYMFRDFAYISDRSDEQEKRFQVFLDNNKDKSIIVFEIGSGPHVQSIRKKTRMLGIKYSAKIVRINPKDFKIKPPHISLQNTALNALELIDNI